MIQSPSLSVLSLIPAAGDMPMPALPEGAELANFGALLAQTIAPAAAPIGGEATPLPQTTIPAAPLPEAAIGGKELPVGLPLAVPVMDLEPSVAKLKPGTDFPDPADLPSAKSGIPVQPFDDKGKDPVLPDPDTLPKVQPGTVAPIVIELVPAQPLPAAPTLAPVQSVPAALSTEPDQPEPEALPRRGPAPQPAAAALEQAAPRAAFLRQVFPARRGGELGAPLAPQVAQPVTPQPAAAQPITSAPQPIAQVRIEVTPAVPVMRALPKEEVRPATSVLPTDLPATPVSTTAPVASTAPAPLTPQPMPLADRPQDFSALIDRLVAAREAAGPQAVAVSVAHSDFGQVHLRFRQDDTGLSVAMASADPAFARAASALPPILPVSDAQSGQFQNGQRQDSSAAPGQSGTGQQRGSTGERQSDQSHGNHPQRQTHPNHSGPTRPQRRAGIFA
jgi:hypothetical protein